MDAATGGFRGAAAADDVEVLARLDALAGAGDDPADLDQIVSACPRVLTHRWLEEVASRPLVAGILRERRSAIDEQRLGWPWGLGPLEQLFEGLDRDFSTDAARHLAGSTLVTASLSRPYLQAASAALYEILEAGDLRRATRLLDLLGTAVEPEIEEADGCRSHIWLTGLDVLRHVLTEVPDDSAFRSALEVERRLLALASAADDTALACDTRYRMSAVLVAPYMVGEISQLDATIKRWAMRAVEAGLPTPVAIPDPLSAFDQAEDRLRRALDDGRAAQLPDSGRIRAQLTLVRLRRGVRQHGGDLPADLVAELTAEAGEALRALAPTDLSVRLEMHVVVATLGAGMDPGALDDVWLTPVDATLARFGLDETVRIVTMTAQVLGTSDPRRALAYLASLAAWERTLPERSRSILLRVHMFAMLDRTAWDAAQRVFETLGQHPGDAPTAPLLGGAQVAAAIEAHASAGSWTPAETFCAVMAVAHSPSVDPGDVLALLGWGRRLAPNFADAHADAVAYHEAACTVDLAQRVASMKAEAGGTVEVSGDPRLAVDFEAEALTRYCELGLADGALECLEIVRNMLLFGGPGIAGTAVRVLDGRLGRLESIGGEQALRTIGRLLDLCISKALAEGDGEAVLIGILMAKGHAFSTAQADAATFVVRHDESVGSLLGRAALLRAELGTAADGEDGFDETRLLFPYLSEQEAHPGTDPVRTLRNLEHAVDEAVERNVLTRALASTSSPWASKRNFAAIQEAIPDGSAVLLQYLVEDPPGRMLNVVVVNSATYITDQPLPVGADGSLQSVTPLGLVQMAVGFVRQRIQEEPGPRPVVKDVAAALEQHAGQFLGPAQGILDDLRSKGYGQLTVVPHGPLHYFPLHLVGPPSTPLADGWLVTVQPSPLSMVTADEQPRRRRGTKAVALGIDFRAYPGPGVHDPIDGVVDEVRAVAAAVGCRGLLNEEVTRAALTEALTDARWLHLATHGMANANAPLFDALVVWPDADGGDRLAAHELLALDLRGLELVTLSACETALGRFDVADNLRGLTATLLRSGARAVVGTLWPVETTAAGAFFTALYEHLGRDATIGQAFGAARAQTRRSHPQHRDWGAFVLVGSTG